MSVLTDSPTIYVALTDPKLMAVGAKVKIWRMGDGKAIGQLLRTGHGRSCIAGKIDGQRKPSQLVPPEKSAVPKDATESETPSADDAAADKAKDKVDDASATESDATPADKDKTERSNADARRESVARAFSRDACVRLSDGRKRLG